MSVQLLANAALIILLVGWIGFRQLTWRPVVVGRMWRLPAILGIVGIFMLAQGSGVGQLKTIDIVALVVEVAVSLGVGALMGRMATFRPLAHPDTTAEHPARMESRTGWWGFGLWFVLIALRIGMDIVATDLGSHLASATGMILILVAANRMARVMVFAYRLDRTTPVTA
jgi:hypothetical protein